MFQLFESVDLMLKACLLWIISAEFVNGKKVSKILSGLGFQVEEFVFGNDCAALVSPNLFRRLIKLVVSLPNQKVSGFGHRRFEVFDGLCRSSIMLGGNMIGEFVVQVRPQAGCPRPWSVEKSCGKRSSFWLA